MAVEPQGKLTTAFGAVKRNALFQNYPNPFNPETWIPFQIASDATTLISIYAVDGSLIRKIALGRRPAGIYLSRDRAAYWDGRDERGEQVASGVYFYRLKIDDFTATRRMVIEK